jgi:hypothetical protein
VIGKPDRERLYDVANAAEARLGAEVNPTVRSKRAFAADDDAFVVQLKSRPLVAVWTAEDEPAA